MKTTGVVRKIDDLGRIVIPKEIRRTLKIRDGESLEIFVDKEMIALKKYSTMEDLQEVTRKLLDAISNTTSKNIFVTDRDKVIAGSGELKKKFLNQPISTYLEEVLKDCENIVSKERRRVALLADIEAEYSYAVCPILAEGGAIGLVLILSMDRTITEEDFAMISIVAQFLAKYVED